MKYVATIAMVSLIASSAYAQNAQQFQLLKGVQRILEQSEREAAEREAEELRLDAIAEQRRQAEEQRKQQTAAAEARRQQALATEARQAQAAELAALSPPGPWANYLVFHRRQLERQTNRGPSTFSVSDASAEVSPNGDYLAYRQGKRLMLRTLSDGTERVLLESNEPGLKSTYFVASGRALLISDWAGKTALIDLQGKQLQGWSQIRSARLDGKGLIEVIGSLDQGREVKCPWVAYHDAATGQLLKRIDLSQPADVCYSRYSPSGKLEVLAIRGSTVDYYAEGQQVRSFEGDSRYGELRGYLVYQFLGDLPYAVSRDIRGEDKPAKIWDLAQGRASCELTSVVWADKTTAYLMRPPELVQLPSCERRAIATSGSLRLDGDLAFLYQPGEITVFGLPDLAVKHRMPTNYRGEQGPYIGRLSGEERYLTLSPSNSKTLETEFFDLDSGMPVLAVPGRMGLGRSHTKSPDYQSDTATFWRVDLPLENDKQKNFLAPLAKDKYETANEYRARTAALSLPFQVDIDVKNYDAEGGYFAGEWRGVPIGVPVPRQQARQLDGISPLTIKGTLGVVDEEFLELRKAVVVLPSGGTIPVQAKPLPPRPAAMESSVSKNVASTVSPTGAASQRAPVCTGTLAHLAPQLRPYTHPLLAEVREAILTSSLQKQSVQSALQAADEAERAAAAAARAANQTDGGNGSIRRVDNGTLPLQWECTGIHASAVCEYINQKWGALAYREIAEMTGRCP